MTIADIAVIAATLLAWSSLVPQLTRLARTGDTAGVSVTWPALGLVTNGFWTMYLLSQGLWAAAPSTAVMVGFYTLVLRALRRQGARLGSALLRGLGWAVLLAVAGGSGGWALLGLVLGWSYGVQLAPSVWSAYAVPDPSGIAPQTWRLIGVEAAVWGFYGWWFADTAIVIYAAIGVAAALLILGRHRATRSAPALESA